MTQALSLITAIKVIVICLNIGTTAGVLMMETKYPGKSVNVNLVIFSTVVCFFVIGSGLGLFYFSKYWLEMMRAKAQENMHWNFR